MALPSPIKNLVTLSQKMLSKPNNGREYVKPVKRIIADPN